MNQKTALVINIGLVILTASVPFIPIDNVQKTEVLAAIGTIKTMITSYAYTVTPQGSKLSAQCETESNGNKQS